MVQYFYEKNIINYTFVVLCGLGFLLRLIVNTVYKHLVKESDSPGDTKNKMLKVMKLRFETCFKLKIGVNNVDTFVDKSVLKYRFCGILLSTWENICGQLLFLNLLLVPICAVFGVAFDCGQEQVLFTGAVGILSGAILILVDKSINLGVKKRMLRLNLLDYLENFCKVRLEKEAFHPELLEQYRREYFQIDEADKQVSAASAPVAKEEPKDELNRRREARRKKEEERKLAAAKREEEQRKLEEARKDEEKRRLEERRRLAAARREEERRKLEEEREALEARRTELKRKATEKQQISERKLEKKEEVWLSQEETQPDTKSFDAEEIKVSLDEIAAESEQAILTRTDKNHTKPSVKAATEKAVASEKLTPEHEVISDNKPEKEEKPANTAEAVQDKRSKTSTIKVKIPGISQQEEKIIEDVLKEFFA